MGYWTDRRKEDDSEIAGVLLSVFPITGEKMDIVSESEEVKRDKSDSYIISSMTKIRLPKEKLKKELPDDVEYSQEWWKCYCQENKLDVATGKSIDSKFLYINPLF